MARRVLVAGQPVTKAGALVAEDAEITLKAPPSPYVSRGGEKLAPAWACPWSTASSSKVAGTSWSGADRGKAPHLPSICPEWRKPNRLPPPSPAPLL